MHVQDGNRTNKDWTLANRAYASAMNIVFKKTWLQAAHVDAKAVQLLDAFDAEGRLYGQQGVFAYLIQSLECVERWTVHNCRPYLFELLRKYDAAFYEKFQTQRGFPSKRRSNHSSKNLAPPPPPQSFSFNVNAPEFVPRFISEYLESYWLCCQIPVFPPQLYWQFFDEQAILETSARMMWATSSATEPRETKETGVAQANKVDVASPRTTRTASTATEASESTEACVLPGGVSLQSNQFDEISTRTVRTTSTSTEDGEFIMADVPQGNNGEDDAWIFVEEAAYSSLVVMPSRD